MDQLCRSKFIDQSLAMANNYLTTDRPNKAVELLSVVKNIDPDNENLIFLGNYIVGTMMGDKYEKHSSFFGKRWEGEDLDGKSIEVFCDQGMGDTIQMLRYLSWMKEKWNCRVVLNCYAYYEKFKELIDGLDYIDQFVNEHVVCDYNTNILSIPGILNKQEGLHYPPRFKEIMKNAIPFHKEIIVNKSDHVFEGDLKIGIAWQSNPENAMFEKKSVPVEEFERFAEYGRLYSLLPTKPDFVEQDFLVNALADTAAVIQEMDYVISVDTVVLHLAGSMNALTIGLLDAEADPRWDEFLYEPIEGECVWYPSIHTYRQEKLGDWSVPLNKTIEFLKKIH